MTWRIAKSLDELLKEINANAPLRSKVSDGSIGDVSHKSRNSDHNAYIVDAGVGVVRARDFTHDPKAGFDSYKFADWLKSKNLPRVRYIISNRRIWNQDQGDKSWRAYSGANPHDHHVHVSVDEAKARYDDASDWGAAEFFRKVSASPSIEPRDPLLDLPLLKKGHKSESVKTLQRLLSGAGFVTVVDGDFGAATKASVKAFQKKKALTQDGIVGYYTWKALQPPSIVTIVEPIKVGSDDSSKWFSAPFAPVDEFGLSWGRTFERFEALPYADPDWTSAAQGYGHNARSGVAPLPKKGDAAWSKEFAEKVYANDVANFHRWLNYYVKVPLKQSHINALVLDIFKYGPTRWANDSPATEWREDEVLLKLNAGDYTGAGNALRSRPHELKGVRRRYGILADIFEGGKPETSKW